MRAATRGVALRGRGRDDGAAVGDRLGNVRTNIDRKSQTANPRSHG
jgi:hypothetical protein